jgi:hypothetical protein
MRRALALHRMRADVQGRTIDDSRSGAAGSSRTSRSPQAPDAHCNEFLPSRVMTLQLDAWIRSILDPARYRARS